MYFTNNFLDLNCVPTSLSFKIKTIKTGRRPKYSFLFFYIYIIYNTIY